MSIARRGDRRQGGRDGLNQYIMCVAVQDGKLEKIFERLDAAQEEIRKCYDDLARLGVLEIKKPLDKASGEKDY